METFGNGRWIGLAGVVAVAVVLFWKGEPPREGLSPARSVPPSADLPGPRAKPADQTPTPVESDQLARQADDAPLISLADAKAAVRLKLHQWAERKPDDSETENRLMDELLALLTDGNAAELTRSLSADERGTPFDLAALERWLGVEPARAARWMAAQSETTEPQALLVARELLKTPADVRAYCDGLSDGDWKQYVLKNASLELAGRDPAEAAAPVAPIPPVAHR